MKLTIAVSILLLTLFSTLTLANPSRELKQAQKLLSVGKYNQAFKEYQRVALEKNNALAKFTLAMFYDKGWGRAEDPVKACQLYGEALQGEDIPAAAIAMGYCFEKGIHQKVDYKAAAKWYQKAADLGLHYALCDLGALHIAGQGVEQDATKGVALCEQSALQGSIPAMMKLAGFYRDDKQLQDNKAALHWFSMAASYQSVEAEYQLGIMLRDGLGIDKNQITAREWFEKSASKGYVQAYREVAALYFDAPVNPETGLWFENDLAKSYLWLSTTLKSSGLSAEQHQHVSQMMAKVKKVMPKTWVADLDVKVKTHLQQFSSQL